MFFQQIIKKLNDRRWQLLLLLVAYVLLVVLIIKPWELYFLNDDFMHVPDKRIGVRSGFLRPVPELLFWLDKQLYGTTPLGFFMTTMLLHGVCVLVLFYFVSALCSRYLNALNLQWVPITSALVFAFYPWHAEPLMWLISRGAILCTVLSLLSYHCYLLAASKPTLIWLSLLFLVGALFTYESVWNALLVFALLSLLNVRLGHSNKKAELYRLAIMCLAFLAYLLFRRILLSSFVGDGYDDMGEKISQFGLVLLKYAKLCLRLFTPPFENSRWFVATAFALTVLHTLAFFVAWKKSKLIFSAMLICLGAAMSSLVTASPFGIDTHYNEGERFLYYASAFYCLLLAIAITQLFSGKKFVAALFILMLVGIYELNRRQKNYAYASIIASTALKVIGKEEQQGRLLLAGVPAQYKGSLIFRTGLPQAIEWIDADKKFAAVIATDTLRQAAYSKEYKTGVMSWNEFANSNNRVLPILKEAGLRRGDALYWFAPGGFYKVMLPNE